MLKRIMISIVGLILIAVVVWLGFCSTQDPKLVIWFGLSSAFFAPLGLQFIAQAFNLNDRNALKKLLKISEIDELIKQAESQEEKIHLLEKEREMISEIIRYETTRRAIQEHRRVLDIEAKRIIDDIASTNEKLAQLEIDLPESSVSKQTIEELYAGINRNSTIRKIYEISILDAIFQMGPTQLATTTLMGIFNMIRNRK